MPKNKKMFLFLPPDKPFDQLSIEDQKYIRYGEAQNFNKGYKCRIRKQWYIVPTAWYPDAFMLRQINSYPKIVLNNTDATNTDTLHKLRFNNGVDGRRVTAAFINSFTFAQCELTGRSYGGGVMTFEPGEVRKLLLPMNNADKLDFIKIDSLIRKNRIESALDYTDQILLKEGLNLSDNDINTLRNIWKKLRDHRINRKKR
ncbi:MAG: hypothetical protein SOI44_03570 [Lactimicrobium sp.]|jgi:adenine-specific DNA-methyltransferase|uniref:hypothetical protein n=1 Tax=Lactimicrobium sp. TaxID=2563780 RepID=UPI002F355280